MERAPVQLSPATRRRVEEGDVAHVEPRLGVPTFFWAARAPVGRSLRDAGLAPEEAARRCLFAYGELYRASPAALAESALLEVHDTGQGAVVVTFEKRVLGVPVFRDRLHVVMTQALELVALTGYLSPHDGSGKPFNLAASTAASAAWLDLTGEAVAPSAFREGLPGEGGYRRLSLDTGAQARLHLAFARARPVYFGLPDRLEPAWYVELSAGARDSTATEDVAWVLSAVDGAVLWRKDLTEADVFAYRVWADTSAPYLPFDGPQGNALTPHPTGTPVYQLLAGVAPQLVSLQNGPISTNDPWLPAGATETTGNNVEAYADLANPDGFGAGDLRATTTAANAFDRVYDVAQGPGASAAQRQAAITQLFYDVNLLHDWFYDRGFNEAAGNAQASNFGRGGFQADSLKAEAQDVGGLNNANMTTPADGARPRMQMYLWHPDSPGAVTVTSPAGLGPYLAGTATFGPAAFSVTGALVSVDDGTAPVTDACTPLVNAAAVAGKIAVIDRGTCTFVQKTLAAQAAGAIGVLVVNNAAGAVQMPGTDGSITIPAVSVSQADGAALRTAMGSGAVTATISCTPTPDRDGSVDNTIVAHEWGHYLSGRLVSDGAGLDNQQGRGLGEGWSDFVALLMVVRAADASVPVNANWSGVYSPGASYALSGPGLTGAGTTSFYYGVRRYPYSTSFTRNALTFRHIQDGVALPTGVPVDPATTPNSEVHNTGEVWATMLWECWAALLRAPRLTFDQAQDRMMRYLVASLKATPGSPTFTEARDALLAVAAATDTQDLVAFAQAFAVRGAGILAVAPPRTSGTNTPVVEDFATGSDLVFVRAELDDELLWCDHDGVLDAGERGRLVITLRNKGVAALSATSGTLTSPTPGVTVLGGALRFTNTGPYGLATATAEVRLTGATAPTQLDFAIAWTDPGLAVTTGHTATASFRAHTDVAPATSAADDVEAPAPLLWTPGADSNRYTRTLFARAQTSAMNHVWHGPDPVANADVWLVSPPLPVAAAGNFSFTFRHRWEMEVGTSTNFDGAVLELSTDNGQTWTDIGASATPGYTGTLGGTNSINPLVGRQAWVGRSAGYPAFITTTVALGAAYQGQTVRVRFRVGADFAVGAAGWDIDDIAFTGLTTTPFARLVADRGQCVNRPPQASAGPDATVDERTTVTLDATGTIDPDGDAVTYQWTQRGGPAVTLSDATAARPTFTTPEVTADGPVTFELVARDAVLASLPDTVVVTVRNVNRAPAADAGVSAVFDERGLATLPGSGADPDGDPLTYAWTQVAGTAVTLSDAASAQPTFTVPEVTADEALAFELVVSDGTLSSPASRLDVTLRNVNRAPVPDAGAAQAVDERTLVSLSGTAVDPEGDAVTYLWRQVAGPTAALSDATAAAPTFTAPEVTADSTLTFELVASDPSLASAPAAVEVTVRNVNRPPVASAGEPREVEAGTEVVLDGSASVDPDGDPLAFSWSRTGGPEVALSDADAMVARFTAPAVKAPTPISFHLFASDGALTAEAAVELTVVPRKARGCGCSGGAGELALFGLLALAGLVRRRR